MKYDFPDFPDFNSYGLEFIGAALACKIHLNLFSCAGDIFHNILFEGMLPVTDYCIEMSLS